jgi:hypothetical protein
MKQKSNKRNQKDKLKNISRNYLLIKEKNHKNYLLSQKQVKTQMMKKIHQNKNHPMQKFRSLIKKTEYFKQSKAEI